MSQKLPAGTTASLMYTAFCPLGVVEVLEAPPVHEALVDRIVGRRTTGLERLVDELIDLLSAFGGQREDRLRVGRRINNLFLGEVLEPVLDQQQSRLPVVYAAKEDLRVTRRSPRVRPGDPSFSISPSSAAA